MTRFFLAVGAMVMYLGVGAGAFGAHGLKVRFESYPLLATSFQTAVRYQLVHGLALLLVAVLLSWRDSSLMVAAGWLFLAGIVLFSGSLYGLSLGGGSWLGPITPLGGLAFLAGWLLIFLEAIRKLST